MKAAKDLTYKLSDFVCLFLMMGWLLFAWTSTYDNATPLGSDAPSVIDDRIREVKAAIQERMNIEHYWPLTGTEVSDAAAGQHRYIEFYGPISTPTYWANKGFLYSKDVNSVVELHWLDESNNEVQLTSGGQLYVVTASIADANVTLAKMDVNSIDSDQYVDGSIDTAHIADANVTAAKLANVDPDSYAGEESVTFVNGLIMKIGYTARSGGWTNIAFSDAFPTAIVSVSVTTKSTGSGSTQAAIVTTVTTAQIPVYHASSDIAGFYWQAWGY